MVVGRTNGMSASATTWPSALPAARTPQARLAPMPSAAFSQTTASQRSAAKRGAMSALRTTTSTRASSLFRLRAACTAIGTPCGKAWRSLSEPKREAEPAARSRPTIFKLGRLLYFAGGGIEAPLGLRRPRGLRDAVAHGGHLGEDCYCDFGRGLRADVEADRAAQPRDLVARDVEFLEAFAARVVVLLRADGADVEGGRFQRFHEGEVIELRIVGQRDEPAVAVELQLAHDVVGHAAVDRHARQVPAVGVFLARIDHHDVVVEHASHLGEIACQLT